MDRCLAEFQATQPDVEIEIVDILQHPMRAVQAKVMIPLIVAGDKRWYSASSFTELQTQLEHIDYN